MTLGNLLLGFVIGFPMMIAVGPISVLLLDQGLQRGVRRAAPAAFGVATADLTLSSVAVIGGARLSSVLAPVAPLLTVLAVGTLVVLAVGLARAAMTELREVRRSRVDAPVMSTVGAPLDRCDVAPEPETTAVDEAARGFAHLGGGGLAAAFYGITLVHPLALVLLVSLVVAGGPGVGTAGWAIGMALASLVAHGGFVVLGGLLGTRLSPVANARLRLGAAAFMAGLAVHFAMV
jgi:arginine exporter protein ArgO